MVALVIAAHMLFFLLVGHALCDLPLQGAYLGEAKHGRVPGFPWPLALAAHSLIHGGSVAIVTGSVEIGLLEIVTHAAIDRAKCRGWFGTLTDQTLHVICKIIWVTLLAVSTNGFQS